MEKYLLGLYEKSMPGDLPLEFKLSAAKAAGFDYMELSIDESDEKLKRLNWTASEIAKLKSAQEDIGLPIKSMCLSGHRKYPLGHPDERIQQRSLEIMRDAISLSARLGIRIIQIAGYDVYYEQSTETTRFNFAKNLAISAELAAREGVILAFETMETEFMNTVEKAAKWIDMIQSPYLQLYPDLGNLTNAAVMYQADVLTDLERGRGHLAALHLKESKPGIFREVPYGEGHVDFGRAVKAALQLGVRLFVGEFWYAGQQNWMDTLKHNSHFLRSFLNAE